MSALRLRNLDIRLPTASGPLHAVRGVDLDIAAGEMLCLVGESGSGKSLTALASMGLLPRAATVSADTLTVMGEEMRGADERRWQTLRGDRSAMIFQDPGTTLDPVWTIGAQMIEGLRAHRPEVGRKAALARAEMLLERTGIDRPAQRLRQYPHQLSGGMRQRVMIAAALMTSPGLLIADEPTTALDASVQAQILALLGELKRELGLAILLITHDLAAAGRHADRIAVMYAGQIVETGPRAAVFAAPLHPYTAALLACRPGPGQRAAIPGTVPSLAPPPAGCAFAARCGHAIAACADAPAFVWATPERGVRCLRDVAALPRAPQPASASRQTPGAAAPVLELRGIGVSYAGHGFLRASAPIQALRNVSLAVPRGGVLGVVGESGSGKSTLARVLLGLRQADTGSVNLDGQPLAAFDRRALARRIQPVFQDPYASLNPRRGIAAIIRLPLDVHAIGAPKSRDAAVRAIMARCGLSELLAQARPGQLSGGQRQRVAIATALVMRPEIVICDEPTSALDVSVQAQILALLDDLRREFGLTYVFISHDLAIVRGIADTVAVMRAGEVVEQGPVETVFATPSHPYTKTLLEAGQ